MGVVLDTSVVIAAERKALRLEDFLRSLGDEPVVLASITASELLHGCYRAADAGIRARRFAFVEGLLQVRATFPRGEGGGSPKGTFPEYVTYRI